MKFTGQKFSSTKPNATMNFKKKDNENYNIFTELQDNSNELVEYNIFQKNNASYIIIQSNLWEWPITLMLDTGASISIIAEDKINKNIKIEKNTINLFGIAGKDKSIETKGEVKATFEVGDKKLDTTMHIVERKYAGPADGYLGYEFLKSYKTIIDLKRMKMKIKLPEEHMEENKKYFAILPFNQNESKKNENKDKKENANKYNTSEYVKYFKDKEAAREYYKKKIQELTNTKMFGIRQNEYENENEMMNRHEIIFKKLKLNNTEDELRTIKRICEDFPFQFYLEGDNLGCTNVVEHKIILKPNAKIVNVRQYKIPQAYKKILQEIVEEYEKQGIVEKCQSPYNSPALIIPKKDEEGEKAEYRFVVDYKKLNEQTEIQDFPIPLIDDILSSFNQCEFYSKIDIKGAFHEIKLAESSRDYTAFQAGNFKYRWLRMPMGLASSPATFQRAINTILADLIGRGVFVYLDDVIIYAKTREEHDKILREVMTRLRENNLQLKISKCIFFASEFAYLGQIISKNGIRKNPQKTQVIRDYAIPTDQKKLQSYLGLCSYFRRYVRNFSTIAKPLTTLLKKEQPFIWTHREQKSFDDLKKALTEDVLLSFPDFDKLFYVTTDASGSGIGGMLSQGDLPHDKPIHFFSKTLSETQRNYSVIERELLAIIEAVKAFRVYLYGRYFVLITDHLPLCYLFNLKDCGSRLFRQKMELLEYNFKVIHRKGAQNHVADALSRLEPLSIQEILEINDNKNKMIATNTPITDIKYFIEERNKTILNKKDFDLLFHLIPTESDTLKDKIVNKLGTDNFTQEFRKFGGHNYIRYISNQFSNRNNAEETKNCIDEILKICKRKSAGKIAVNIDYDNIRHYFYFKNTFQEIFKRETISTTFFLNKIIEIIEDEDKMEIMRTYHLSLLGGHFGVDKTLRTIQKFFVWDNMGESIRDFIKKCPTCEKTKVITNTKVPMMISSNGEMLMDHVFIDFVGPIKTSRNNNKYIFTAICDVTKFLVAVPTKDCTALTAAKCLLEHILCRYNFPSRLISDNATSFISNVIKELTHLFDIKKVFSTRYHPISNKIERAHRTIGQFLKAFAKDKDKWDELLKFATFAYNNTVHTTTNYCPHFLAHGFNIRIPNRLTQTKISYNYDNLAETTRNNIAEALKLAKENLHNRKLQNKLYYDRDKTECEIKENDMVLVKNMNKKHKFDEVYIGPFKVLKSNESYVEIMQGTKKAKYHKNMIKKAQAQHTIEQKDDEFQRKAFKLIYNIDMEPIDNSKTIDKAITMDETPTQTAYKHIDMEIKFTNIPIEYEYEDLWAWTSKHVEYMKCAPEWKAFTAFCLMWATTMAYPKRENFMTPKPEKWNVVGKLDAGLKLKIKSNFHITNFEFKYNSDSAPILENRGFEFKMAVSDCLCQKTYATLIDALRFTLPFELRDKPCSTFMKPYKLYWNKTEDPYILQINQ